MTARQAAGWIDVVRLAPGGDGVTADGRFIAGTVPGDRVRGDPAEIAPGPDHATPPCRHFPDCGGCQLQHVADAAYARWVPERIAAALTAAGVGIGVVEPTALSPPRSRRRASLRAVSRRGRVALGFNVEGSHRVVDLLECHILTPTLFALVEPLRALLAATLPDDGTAAIALTETDTGIDLVLAGGFGRRLVELERLGDFAVVHDLARLSVEGPDGTETIVAARPPVVRLGGVAVAVPPAPFLQATREGEAALVAAVLTVAAGAKRVVDLFAGLGTFALPLAAAGAEVLAVEGAAAAIAALATGAGKNRLRVQVSHRDLFRRPLPAAELAGFDAVVIDPPRAGAAAQMTALAASRVHRIAAVSCNPNTFARDAKILTKGGYRLDRLWPIAQFRWSTHVELVAAFSRS